MSPHVKLVVSVLLAGAVAVAVLPRTASATCGRNDCPTDTRQVSAVTVQHLEQVSHVEVYPVEPDSGETIEVLAYWDTLNSAPGCSCHQTDTESITVDVDWSDATDSWSASCTGCDSTNGPFYGVTVCHVGGCNSIDNAWAYELVVQIAKVRANCPAGPAGYLSEVDYTTTSVDDGDTIRISNCSEWYGVSPTSQTFTVTDSGGFECTYTCAAASGPTLTLLYE